MTLLYDTVIVMDARRYTLAELADVSAAALDALGIEARNGQVRDRPDTRTIRYYSALGLVDRPAEMSGRTALYSGRHLLQVLAVKALQARGASLADVQRSLVGASEAELRSAVGPELSAALNAAAEFSPTRSGTASASAAGPAVAGPSAGRAFWRNLPPAPAGPVPALAQPRRMIVIPLAPGATLLIDSDDGREVDVAALHAAAGPLLTYLTSAGLLPALPDHPTDTTGADR